MGVWIAPVSGSHAEVGQRVWFNWGGMDPDKTVAKVSLYNGWGDANWEITDQNPCWATFVYGQGAVKGEPFNLEVDYTDGTSETAGCVVYPLPPKQLISLRCGASESYNGATVQLSWSGVPATGGKLLLDLGTGGGGEIEVTGQTSYPAPISYQPGTSQPFYLDYEDPQTGNHIYSAKVLVSVVDRDLAKAASEAAKNNILSQDGPKILRFIATAMGENLNNDSLLQQVHHVSQQVMAGTTLTLMWNLDSTPDQISIEGASDVAGESGTVSVTATKSCNYTLRAKNSDGESRAVVWVTVHQPGEQWTDTVQVQPYKSEGKDDDGSKITVDLAQMEREINLVEIPIPKIEVGYFAVEFKLSFGLSGSVQLEAGGDDEAKSNVGKAIKTFYDALPWTELLARMKGMTPAAGWETGTNLQVGGVQKDSEGGWAADIGRLTFKAGLKLPGMAGQIPPETPAEGEFSVTFFQIDMKANPGWKLFAMEGGIALPILDLGQALKDTLDLDSLPVDCTLEASIGAEAYLDIKKLWDKVNEDNKGDPPDDKNKIKDDKNNPKDDPKDDPKDQNKGNDDTKGDDPDSDTKPGDEGTPDDAGGPDDAPGPEDDVEWSDIGDADIVAAAIVVSLEIAKGMFDTWAFLAELDGLQGQRNKLATSLYENYQGGFFNYSNEQAMPGLPSYNAGQNTRDNLIDRATKRNQQLADAQPDQFKQKLDAALQLYWNKVLNNKVIDSSENNATIAVWDKWARGHSKRADGWAGFVRLGLVGAGDDVDPDTCQLPLWKQYYG